MTPSPANVTGVTYNGSFDIYWQYPGQSTYYILQENYNSSGYNTVDSNNAPPIPWPRAVSNGSGYYCWQILNSGDGGFYSGVTVGSAACYSL